MIDGRWFIGPHAVQRFLERSPFHNLSYDEALAVMVKMSERAHFIGRTKLGCEVWRGPAPLRMRFIIGPGEGPLPSVRTVRPPHRTSSVYMTEHGVVVHKLGDLESVYACAGCGRPYVPIFSRQETCGAKRCRGIMQYAKDRENADRMAARRERCARWYAANRERHIANVMARRKAA